MKADRDGQKRFQPGKYIWREGRLILLYLGCMGIFTFVLYLHNAPLGAIRYAFFLSLFLLLIAEGIHSAVCVVRFRRVRQSLAALPGEWKEVPKPVSQTEELYREELENLYHLLLQAESKMRIGRQEMEDYYGMWAHQIKTPIAALHVLIQSLEEEVTAAEEETCAQHTERDRLLQQMKMEVFQTEQYVEMALSYLRSEEMSGDLLLKEYNLDELVRQAVKKYSSIFILKRIHLDYEKCETTILTDEKWFVFVLEQLLSNALKYTAEEGRIAIYKEPGAKGRLVIADNGIGIQPEDLPRIFEKGFTGFNGRRDKKATGIGLYLCKRICKKLGQPIDVASEVGVGTKFFLRVDREFRCRQ